MKKLLILILLCAVSVQAQDFGADKADTKLTMSHDGYDVMWERPTRIRFVANDNPQHTALVLFVDGVVVHSVSQNAYATNSKAALDFQITLAQTIAKLGQPTFTRNKRFHALWDFGSFTYELLRLSDEGYYSHLTQTITKLK